MIFSGFSKAVIIPDYGGNRYLRINLNQFLCVADVACLMFVEYTIYTLLRRRLLNHLRVFVTRSRHKCSIGLNDVLFGILIS